MKRRIVGPVVAGVLVISGPWLWTTFSAMGHLHDEDDTPAADVAIVLGTEVLPAGRPSVRLAGRLTTAAELVKTGRARW